jgi:putative Mg2+ transporter-C (MgtC) family protein
MQRRCSRPENSIGAVRPPAAARGLGGFGTHDASRVIQGVVTGVGFLGAGVIVRSEKRHHVQGLTTAACVWVTACIGAACAIAQWEIVVIGVVLILVILVFCGRFERVLDRRWSARKEVADRPPDTPA